MSNPSLTAIDCQMDENLTFIKTFHDYAKITHKKFSDFVIYIISTNKVLVFEKEHVNPILPGLN